MIRTISKTYYTSKQVEAFLISSRENKRYLCDLNSSRGYVLACEKEMIVLVDGRYYGLLKDIHPELKIQLCNSTMDYINAIQHFINIHHIHRIGLEQDILTYQSYIQLSSQLDVTALPISLSDLRMIKTEEEIAFMKQACNIATTSLKEILPAIKEGVTEKYIADILNYTMRLHKAEKESFDIIVASGTNGAFPHLKATNKRVQSHELITIDFGCIYQAYCSDITRTLALGSVSDQLIDIYNTVLEAHDRALHSIQPSISCNTIDKVARDYITSKGYGSYFIHNLGHGIGMQDHEEPAFSPTCHTILQKGMVLSDEPGIYIEGIGGVRIEDDVLVSDDGYELLSEFERKLIVL